MNYKRVDVENDKLIIVFRFDSEHKDLFREALPVVRTLRTRTYHMDSQYWEAAVSEYNIEKLKLAGFEFTARAQKICFPKGQEYVDTGIQEEMKKMFPEYKQYQLDGILFLERRKGRGLIADQMGLGKTAQALGYLKRHPSPSIIVCPATIKFAWREEIKKWLPGSEIAILEGKTPRLFNFPQFTIINYDILGDWLPAIQAYPFKILIGDEIQYISNDTAIRTNAFISLARTKEQVIFLSGSPIKNRTAQFFNCLNLLAPEEFPNKYRFLHRYCDPRIEDIWMKKNGKAFRRRVWTYNGSTNWEELREKISKVMIRREKKDVLKELPEKQKIIIPLPVNKKAYEQYLKEENIFIDWAKRERQAHKDKKKMHIEHLKESAYLTKRESIIEWLKDFLETGQKFVIFAHHSRAIEDLYSAFPKQSVFLDGSTKDREEVKKKFWEDKSIQLFIGQDQAAGVGLNLQCASAMGMAEFPYSPEDAEQCEDRIHRMGQKGEAVFAYYFVAEGTIDLHIAEMLMKKNRSIKRLLDGKEDAKFFGESEMIDELLLKYGVGE